MSVSFEMVKCRNKKYLYCKPTRFALFIRSQSLSAVSEMRVWLDGFVIFMVDACDAPHLGCGQSTYAKSFLSRFFASLPYSDKDSLRTVWLWLFLTYMTFLTYALWFNCIASDENSLGVSYLHQNYLYSLKSVEGQYVSLQIFIVINSRFDNKSQRI